MTVLIVLLAVAAYVGLGRLAQVYTDRQWVKLFPEDDHALPQMRVVCYLFPPAAAFATVMALR